MSRKKLTQTEIVLNYLKRHKSITPAKLVGTSIGRGFAGSELPRTCRALRQLGLLISFRKFIGGKEERFVSFSLK